MNNTLLACAKLGDHYGYINVLGEWVIRPQYAGASAFNSNTGLARTHDGKKWGVIDKAGTWRIAPQFDDISDFFSGGNVARAATGDKWGLIDNQGRWLIAPAFRKIEAALPGLELYPAADMEFRWGLVDAGGAWKLEPRYKSVGRSSAKDTVLVSEYGETIVSALTLSGGQWVRSPLTSLPPAKPTGSEYRLISIGDGREQRWGVKDHGGNWLIKPSYESLRALEDGRQFVAGVFEPPNVLDQLMGRRGNRTNYGVIDLHGEWLINPVFGWIGRFDALTGLAAATTTDTGKTWMPSSSGYIDKGGRWAFKPRFPECRDFWDGTGIASAKDFGKTSPEPWQWGLVNARGEWRSQLFDRIRGFDPSSRLIAVELNEKHGFLGIDGTIAIALQFDDIDTKFY